MFLRSSFPRDWTRAARRRSADAKGDTTTLKVTPFLIQRPARGRLGVLTATFPDSEIKHIARLGKDGPITSAEFVIGGQPFMGYNRGPTSRSPRGSRSL